MVWLGTAGIAIAAGLSLFFVAKITQSQNSSRAWRQRYEAERSVAESLRRPVPPQPLVGATFYLSTARGAESDTSEPVNRVTMQPDLQWIILSLGGRIEPGFQSLRATLKDSTGRDIWKRSGLPAISQEPLSVAIPSALLRTGNYVFTVEGLSPEGRYLAAGVYRLRVLTR
jgi:hypothetical protein